MTDRTTQASPNGETDAGPHVNADTTPGAARVGTAPVDTAHVDTAPLDTVPRDSATLDTATPDTAALDSATPDTATPDTATLDAMHRTNRRRALIPLVFIAIGVLAMGRRSFLRDDGGDGLAVMLVVGVIAVVLVAVVMIRMTGSTADRHHSVRALRRHAEVIEVWGAVGLGDALHAEGVHQPPVRARQGTALSMVLTSDGVELWAGTSRPQLIWTTAWADLETVVEGAGVVAGDGAKPAVVLVTRTGNGLVLLPARNPAGGLRTARVADVRELVGRLEGMRVAS